MRTESLPICRHITTKIVFAIILVLASFQFVWAQNLATYGAPSLLFSPSAVASGFGSGAAAASTEASAIYYNPAALSRIGRVALEMNTFKLFPLVQSDARYYHIAGALRSSATSKLWLGAAYTRLGFGEQTITSEAGPEPLGKFEPYESNFSLAAATKIGERSSLGIGFKYVRINYGPIPLTSQNHISASAFAVDMGFLYDGFLQTAHLSRQFLHRPLPWQRWAHDELPPGFSLGVTLAHVGTQLNFSDLSRGVPLPQNFRVGLSWNLITSDVVGLVATGEFAKILVKRNGTGSPDGALKAIFTAWGDQSLRDEFSQAIYTGGLEVRLLQLAAIRFGRFWYGGDKFGFNTFGYSIGPPGLRFSFARFALFESLFIDEWHIYTVSVGMSKLPF